MPPYFPDYVLNPQSCHDDVHTDTVPGEAVPGEAVPVEAVSVEAEPDNGDPDEVDSVEADAGDVIAEEDVDSGDESVKIYPYEMRRNERVAERMAEFNRQFPDFEEEVRSLKVVKAVKKKKPKTQQPVSRRSNRVQKQTPIGMIDDESCEVTEAGDTVNVEEEISDVIETRDTGSDADNAAQITEAGDNEGEEDPPVVTEAGNIESVEENASVGEEGTTGGPGRFVCVPCGCSFR